MKKLMLLVVMVLLALTSRLPAASGAFNPGWLPAQAKWVVHFDHTLFLQTGLYSLVSQHWLHDRKGVRAEIMNELDFDIDKDLSGLTIVGLDRVGDERNLMIIIQGNFDQEKIVKTIQRKSERKVDFATIAGLRVLKWDSHSHLFFPAKELAVFCDSTGGIEEAVNLWKGKAKAIAAASPLAKLLAEAPGNAFIRVAATDVSRLARFAPKTMVLESTSAAFFMAMEAKEQFSMLLRLVTDSEAKAKNLEQVMAGIVALIKLKTGDVNKEASLPKKEYKLLELLNGIKFSVAGNQLVMNFACPVDKIGELLAEMRGKRAAGKH